MTLNSEKDNTELKFGNNSFFSHTILGFSPHENKHTKGTYQIDKIISITTVDKFHLKSDYIYGSIVNGIRRPIFFQFCAKCRSRT